jgi:hypothetical protein
MKHIQLYEQFVNEKAYQMTGIYGAKGIIGKVLFGFKKEIERIKYEGDADATLAELNSVWSKWADKDGAKIIEQEVMKQVKDKEALVYVMATLGGFEWVADEVNRLNTPGNSELFVTISNDFVINVGFADDADSSKFSRKLDGMQNSAILNGKETAVIGSYDNLVGENNIEIRTSMFLSIDAK